MNHILKLTLLLIFTQATLFSQGSNATLNKWEYHYKVDDFGEKTKDYVRVQYANINVLNSEDDNLNLIMKISDNGNGYLFEIMDKNGLYESKSVLGIRALHIKVKEENDTIRNLGVQFGNTWSTFIAQPFPLQYKGGNFYEYLEDLKNQTIKVSFDSDAFADYKKEPRFRYYFNFRIDSNLKE